MKKFENIEFAYDATIMFSADGTFLFAREPLLRRMPDGSLYAFIYTGGPKEAHPDNVVAATRSTDNGVTWSKPEVIFKHPYYCTWATEFFTDGPRPFCAFQTFDFRSNYCSLRAYFSYTDDSGHTWSEPVTVPGVPPNFTVRQGKILSDGSWVFPVYWDEVQGNWDGECKLEGSPCASKWNFVSGVIRSTDQGKSFLLHGSLNCGKYRSWEPAITELEAGHLRMYIRCESPEHVLWEADSFDYGKTWTSTHPGEIPNPGTKMDILDVKGHKLLFNNVFENNNPDRTQLEVWVSDDNCRSWKKKIRLATLQLEKGKCCWDGFWNIGGPLTQVAYPHAFSDEKEQCVYVAIDSVRKHFLMKVPFADLF